MSESPSKASKLEKEALLDDLDDPMEQAVIEIPGQKRRTSLASSSVVSSFDGIRTIVNEEMNSLFAANIVGPLVKELQEQMQVVRLQQLETVAAGKEIILEIQKAMKQQQTVQSNLEGQMQATDQRQKQHENAIYQLTKEALGSGGRVQQLSEQNDYTQQAVQQIHQQQMKTESELRADRVQTNDVSMHSSSSTMDVGRDSRGLGRPLIGQYLPQSRTKPMTPDGQERRNESTADQRIDPELFGGENKFLPNARIAPIPVFEVSRYTSWRREICFWKELHDWLPEKQIISFVGLNGGTIIRSKVMKLFKDNAACPEQRTFKNLLELLDRDFAMTAREKDMQQMDKLFEYRREEGESIQGFWAKFDLLLSHLDGSTSCLSDELLFMRSLRAMNLSYGQRTSLLSLLDCRALAHSVTNLRLCSIQLLGLYKGFDKKDKEARKVLAASSDSVLVTKKGKRNRPGLEDQALRRTNSSMNVKNSVLTVEIQPSEEILAMERAQGVCYRCGSKDHFLKSCPKPFTTVLAFAPDKKGGAKGKSNTTNVRLADEEQGMEKVEEVIEESSGQNTPEILIEQEEEAEDQSPDTVQEDAWGA